MSPVGFLPCVRLHKTVSAGLTCLGLGFSWGGLPKHSYLNTYASVGDPDPHHFGKLDPDPHPHRSGKLDPDLHPHRNGKLDPDPHPHQIER